MLQRQGWIKQEASVRRTRLEADIRGGVWAQRARAGTRCPKLGEVWMSKITKNKRGHVLRTGPRDQRRRFFSFPFIRVFSPTTYSFSTLPPLLYADIRAELYPRKGCIFWDFVSPVRCQIDIGKCLCFLESGPSGSQLPWAPKFLNPHQKVCPDLKGEI